MRLHPHLYWKRRFNRWGDNRVAGYWVDHCCIWPGCPWYVTQYDNPTDIDRMT